MSGTLVDANLLCLLIVGRNGVAAITKHPRLAAYDADSLNMLGQVLDHSGNPVLCPHVLAETANLLAYRQSSAQQRQWRAIFADVIEQTREISVEAMQAILYPDYLLLGLTDAIMLILAANENLTLLSDDLALCLAADRAGLRNINFNHLRDGALRIDQL